jgi:hypothetical protein
MLPQWPDGHPNGLMSIPSDFDGMFIISNDGMETIPILYYPEHELNVKGIYYKFVLLEQDEHVYACRP